MKNIPSNLHEIFPLWQTLSTEQQRLLDAAAMQKKFGKGSFVRHGQNDCMGLCLVRDGQLRVFIISDTGKEITLYRLFAWDVCLFSASCVMKNINFDIHIQAEKDTEVFVVPAGIYEELMKTSLPVADYTNQLMASRFSDVMWVMEKVLFASFDSRLAGFLLEMSVIEESGTLSVTHDEIARNLGTAREVVTKMLNYLAGEGMVELKRGKVTLLDEEKLRALAG